MDVMVAQLESSNFAAAAAAAAIADEDDLERPVPRRTRSRDEAARASSRADRVTSPLRRRDREMVARLHGYHHVKESRMNALRAPPAPPLLWLTPR